MNIFDVPHYVTQIMDTIETAGFETFLVGGCVRDMLLRRTPSDWDIASSAPPQEIMRIFEKTVPTGLKYGTVTVICDEGKAEVTTYRRESGYEDFRRPSHIHFCSDIKTDLSRRDFTVNAMAFNPSRGLFDPFDGRGDLENHRIRAVGDPVLRFEEDALRILRAYRFAAQLGFEVEQRTLEAARDRVGLVAKISGERIKSELDRILMSGRPRGSLTLVCTGALDFLGFDAKDVSDVMPVCDRFALVPAVLAERWTAFFYIAHPVCVRTVMVKLRFDVCTKDSILRLLAELEQRLPADSLEIKKRLSSGFTPEQYKAYLNLRAALTGCDVSDRLTALQKITAHGEPYSLRMLAVSGTDILHLGVASGPLCGRVLAVLLDKVIDDPSLNDKKTLICLAKQELHFH